MKVHIENIGIVKQANILVDGLTVIAGYNDSGKSTVGKILYKLHYGMDIYPNTFSQCIGKLNIEDNGRKYELTFPLEKDGIKSPCKNNLFFDVTIIDTPMILSDDFEQRYLNQRGKRVLGHQNDLIGKLLQPNEREENIVENTFQRNRLQKLDDSFQEVLKGNIIQDNGKLLYKTQGQSFGVASLASGLKSYVIIRHLLENGYLGEKSLLIIDEPEVHLHPQWQLHFAELLVRMSEVLHIHMILTTHSPYFLQALEVFSRKYRIRDNTHFYLAQREADGAVIDNIDNNIDAAYNLLAQPIMTLRELFEEQQENEDDD